MKAQTRREQIINMLSASTAPISAGALKDKLGVSRQVIVQDIAVLRAQGYDVTATSRGYLLASGGASSRVFKCRHTLEEGIEEGEIIISSGGVIEDVSVNHRIYGTISAKLSLSTRVHVEELYRSLASGASKPLMSVTDGFHYHTVSAADASVLDGIEKKLRERGFLIEK